MKKVCQEHNKSSCKKCYYNNNREYFLEKQKAYYHKNKEDVLEYQKQYRENNNDAIKEKKKQYYEDNKEEKAAIDKAYYEKNKEKIKKRSREYSKNNRKQINKYKQDRMNTDVFYRLSHYVSTSINKKLKVNNGSKNNKSINYYLPYSIDQLKLHIEALFEPWMNWENHGAYNVNTWDDNDPATWTWNIDHIIPQSHLPYSSMEDENFRKCWALDNLRPLSAKQNVLDKNRR